MFFFCVFLLVLVLLLVVVLAIAPVIVLTTIRCPARVTQSIVHCPSNNCGLTT